jgi:hypothetical protein
MPLHSKRIREQAKDTLYARQTPNRRDSDPLDGSTSGTIGGGGPESGGRSERAAPPDTPPMKPDNAASGRLAPDPLASSVDRDDLRAGASDVSNASGTPESDDDGRARRR